jgi:hypothetical protein
MGRKVTSENTRLPYEAPRLSGDRGETYPLEASHLEHLQGASFTRIPLADEDNRNAIADAANLSAFEYINRMTTDAIDETLTDGLTGKHIAPQFLNVFIDNLEEHQNELEGKAAAALDQLRKAAEDARASGKSLVFIKDHEAIPDAPRAAALTDELNHAMQRAGTGPLDTHLRGSAAAFVKEGLGSRAAQSIEQNLGYEFRSPSEAAAEIGVRLMEPDRYQELGLSRSQAHALALEYVQRSGKGVRTCQSQQNHKPS